MRPCRKCRKEIAEDAVSCPNCGTPFPAKEKWEGFGYEYKSGARILGLPLLHISFKYRVNRAPVPAKGIIAIGQFALGVVTISQFGVGIFSLGQFALAGFALAQFAAAYSLIAQIGLYIHQGYGQFVTSLSQLLG